MKAIILLGLFAIASVSCLGQELSTDNQLLKDKYLAKRKDLKTTGALLEVGAVIGFTVAMATDLQSLSFDWTDPNSYKPAPNMTWLYVTSCALMVGGAVCYISASKYKRKAQAIAFRFKLNKTEFLQQGFVSSKPLPSLAISIPLN